MTNPFSYAGKRVVVTGAATGVGAALLDLLAEIGAPDVTVLDIKAPSGPHTTFIETNLSDKAAVEAAIGQISGPVDVLFNNAGVAATQPPLVVLAVNYLALRRLSEGLLEQIPAGGAMAARTEDAQNSAFPLMLVMFIGYGAAFSGLQALPHVAGLITNLADDLALVDQMHAALFGEIRRRQELLRAAGNLATVRDYHSRLDAGILTIVDLP